MEREALEKLDPDALDALVEIDVFGLYMDPDEEMRAREFSTDIAAAWQVVEQLSGRFWCRITSPFDEALRWSAGFTPLSCTGWNGRPDFEAGADTAPRAICIAALLAASGTDLEQPEEGSEKCLDV